MTDDDDIDGLAAEYVLETPDLAERQRVAARCRTDAALGKAIKAWERRLGPLSGGPSGRAGGNIDCQGRQLRAADQYRSTSRPF